MATYTANLNVMVKAARSAARGLIRDFGEVENLQVSVKGVSDFVSNADVKAEQIIRAELTHARPAYGWLAEESEEVIGADETRRWIVDPLDGTTNFLHGMPHWAISIAMEHKGEIVAAVVLDPAKDEMYTAEKGAGAWMNGRRIRVSARRDLSECVFATGIPFGAKTTMPETIGELTRLMPQCAGVRRLGAAALDLAWVAAGRYDGYWERELNAWDVAAGLLLVKEAGGFVGDLAGGKDMFAKGEVLATNAEVRTRFVKALSA